MLELSLMMIGFSPRTWGCSTLLRSPHTRGDGPDVQLVIEYKGLCSPRKLGYCRLRCQILREHQRCMKADLERREARAKKDPQQQSANKIAASNKHTSAPPKHGSLKLTAPPRPLRPEAPGKAPAPRNAIKSNSFVRNIAAQRCNRSIRCLAPPPIVPAGDQTR